MAGIYIHIPFCRQACHYCDFHFSTNLQTRAKMLSAMCQEVNLSDGYLADHLIETIYLGGGTPSLLTSTEIARLLDEVYRNHAIAPECEVTLEANPDDLNVSYIHELKNTGVNRLSIGIQSFNDPFLRYMNRVHNSKIAFDCVQNAQQLGFENISVDLIYGIPSETHDCWEKDVEATIALGVPHLSAYCLTIEPKTAFGKWKAKGLLETASDDFAAYQYEYLLTQLEQAGYEAYEISNFCKPGWQSKHNSNYWSGTEYLGIGPGAHSYNGFSRRANISDNQKYIDSLSQSLIPATVEFLTPDDKLNEYILTSIRTASGLDVKRVLRDAPGLKERYTHMTKDLVQNRLAEFKNSVLTLTLQGKLLADEITSKLMV